MKFRPLSWVETLLFAFVLSKFLSDEFYMKSFIYLMTLLVFSVSFSKEVWTDNKYYHYEIDEQIKISEDKDYIWHSRELLKEKALKDQAQKKHKLMRKKEQSAHDKARKEQVRQRHKLSLTQKNQERLKVKYEEEMKRYEKQQEKLNSQYVKQKHRERKSLIREQANIENKFYNGRPLLK